MAKKTKGKEATQPTQDTLDPVVVDETIKVEEKDYTSLIKQVEAEYQLAWWYMRPKMDEWAVRLKLYNNQKKDKEAIGDPLMFTIHQTVLAALYNDKMGVEFLGRESGDEETAENLNAMAMFDYDEMEKDVLDYEWDWDSAFFGRGLLLNNEFDRKIKCPMPEVIDVMTWLRDPRATSVNGDRKGRGAMKFGGREIRLSKTDMDTAGIYFNYADLKADNGDLRSLIDANVQARANAQGFSDTNKFDNLSGDNADYRALEWFTSWKGKKVLVTLADNHKRVIRYTELDGVIWPIIDRPFYPIAHDWDGVSIPDLVEDKQRGRAIVQNLGIKGIKLGLNPTYLYNTNLIKNRGNLELEFNKHIPVDGNPTGAVQEVQRQQVKAEVNWIMDVLNRGAERATATPDIQMGMTPAQGATATEMNMLSQKIDSRYSLSAKIWGWSEKRFWKQWYSLYKTHFNKDIDEKVIRIVGAMGAKWRPLTRENIVANTDPDIVIESKTLSDAIKTNELQKYRLFIKDVMSTDPQNTNIRFALERIGRLSGLRKDEIEQVLPPSIDEMNADTENDKLNEDKLAMVQVYDDDFIHFEIHNKAADTPAKTAHINAHKKAMMLKRVKPQFDMANNRPENPTGTQDTKPANVNFVPPNGVMPKGGAGMPAVMGK